MAVPYPTGLPLGLRQGRTYNTVSTMRRSQMANGRAIQRRAFTDVPVLVKVSWLFNDPQVTVFEAWFRYKLNDGVSWFDMTLAHPLGRELYECRFTDVYDGPTEASWGLWTISATLELRTRPLLPEDATEFPEYILDAGIFDIAINIKLPEVN